MAGIHWMSTLPVLMQMRFLWRMPGVATEHRGCKRWSSRSPELCSIRISSIMTENGKMTREDRKDINALAATVIFAGLESTALNRGYITCILQSEWGSFRPYSAVTCLKYLHFCNLYCPCLHKPSKPCTMCNMVHEHWLMQIGCHCNELTPLTQYKIHSWWSIHSLDIPAKVWAAFLGHLLLFCHLLSSTTNSNMFEIVTDNWWMRHHFCAPGDPLVFLYALCHLWFPC